jgi:hypothetical protein
MRKRETGDLHAPDPLQVIAVVGLTALTFVRLVPMLRDERLRPAGVMIGFCWVATMTIMLGIA